MYPGILHMDSQVMQRSVEKVLERTPEIIEEETQERRSPVLGLTLSLDNAPITTPKRAPSRLPTIPSDRKKPIRLQRVERPALRPATANSTKTTSRHSKAESFLVKSADSVELSMLKSIARLRLGSRQGTRSFDESLREHEYEDISDPEDLVLTSTKSRNVSSAHPHANRLVKQKEVDSGTPQSIRRRAQSAQSTSGRHLIREMENRQQGFRHEKTSSTQRSQKSTDFSAEAFAGLIYDADFDCYYCPDDDTYYRVAVGEDN